jgi:hypothetical protein
MREAAASACYFCGSKNVALRDVGISMGMGGNDYSFCETCLTSMTAAEFWRKFFKEHDWEYPLDAATVTDDRFEH